MEAVLSSKIFVGGDSSEAMWRSANSSRRKISSRTANTSAIISASVEESGTPGIVLLRHESKPYGVVKIWPIVEREPVWLAKAASDQTVIGTPVSGGPSRSILSL